MPRVGFEPMTSVFTRAKTVHALDRVATMIGTSIFIKTKYDYQELMLQLYSELSQLAYDTYAEVLPVKCRRLDQCNI
jgi:hypothetical protein